uniref:PH domain-containing protein n=1 Tax=Timema poppense TaxID=170557 RepID=A0A7R9CJ33_TIMPO|nr:unnamed protein product [Timema poppensis]
MLDDSELLAMLDDSELRAMLDDYVELRAMLDDSSLLSGKSSEIHAIKKGLLWQQRDRIFSRWKERYFILTRDYLHCFKRASGSGPDRISDMGQFIFKVKLADVERVDWINRKTYSTIVLELGREGRVLLRAADGLEDWFELLEERRRALRSSHDPSLQQHNGTLQNNNSINSTLDEWLLARHKIGCVQHLSDSVPDLNGEGNSRGSTGESSEDHQEENQWLRRRPPNHEQRLSCKYSPSAQHMLTDIDINDSDTLLDTPPPSVTASIRGRPTSYRLNSDVFFMSPGYYDFAMIYATSTVYIHTHKRLIYDLLLAPCTSRVKCQNQLIEITLATVPSEASERLRYGGGTATPSFCSSRPVLTPVGSFRSTHLFNPSKMAADRYSVMSDAPQLTRYRERAHSEVHKLERHNWKMKAETNRRTSFMVHATQV